MEESITPMKTGLRYGLILGLAISVFSLIAHYSGLQDPTQMDIKGSLVVTLITWVILAVLFFMGVKYYKEQNEGHLTLGEGMVTSMFIGLVSGIISVIFTYVFFTFIAPEMLSTITDVATADIDQSGMSEDQTAAIDGMMGFVTSPAFLAGSTLVSRLFSALIFGLVSSLILKTD